MEHRKALTISLTVDKDNSLIRNPLKIPKACLSSECGNLKAKIHLTRITECKSRYLEHKNGSTLSDHNHATMVRLGMASRKPCLVLTDVLKTEEGKAYLSRERHSQILGNGTAVTGRELGQKRETPQTCKGGQLEQREAKNQGSGCKNSSATPKHSPKIISLSAQRLNLRVWSDGEDEKKEDSEVKEVIMDQESVKNCSEVADCVLSVSSGAVVEPGTNKLSSENSKETETQTGAGCDGHSKRKRDTPEPCHNGEGIPMGHKGSVLSLYKEGARDGELGPKRRCLDGGEGETGLEILEYGFVEIALGADEGEEGGVSLTGSPDSVPKDSRVALRQSLSSSQDDSAKASPSEPIVLSSDDEQGAEDLQHYDPLFDPLISAEEARNQRTPTQEVFATQGEEPDMQTLHMIVEDFPGVIESDIEVSPVADYCVGVAFYTLLCGGYQGEANGDVMITGQRVIIPLKDASGQVEVTLTLECTQLRKYSVWEKETLQDRGLVYASEEQLSPDSLLLLYVSDTQAQAVQRDLQKLSVKQQETLPTGQASPFLLLSLKIPPRDLEGAVLRSILDIVCLKSLVNEETAIMMENLHTPILSLDDSLELIERTGLDPQLLALLGRDGSDRKPDMDQDLPLSDDKKEPELKIQLENDLQTSPEKDAEPKPEPEEEKDREQESPTEESKVETRPIYTLCHRRVKESYSVSLSKPDNSWTKYNLQRLARRLIQYPPPPLKGGITVTMEDLKCLDSGQFLNDVIIDFYLKYLLQSAPAAVTERSHIFSSFFYKQLTRRDNASEDSTYASSQRHRRHQRVKTWTRHVDIFKKDFLFVPVNQEAHWYLVVICFPGLEEPQSESWRGPDLQKGTGEGKLDNPQAEEEAQGSNDVPEAPASSSSRDAPLENTRKDSTKEPPPWQTDCTEQTCKKKTVCKRPCILTMDSLKLSLHERVCKLLREYLQSEWEVRRGSVRDFSGERMKSSHCQVPLQDNSSDCGLYLLQYVESFLKDPVVDFELPLCLQRWFSRQQVRRKRDEIRDLILNLYRRQNLENVG
ncbi:sentrin-specific protease 7 [Lampris incognitus]|uniref:sentrin-specific protease 7 n=1 Tax=Lampris incognitus TaxID=2546036 RepID=UPI0024B578DE|nr:sentrin-specific protease 7 [Lampris incognitus]XP_056145507.1 sentrin-specific protease 7 [Lampris incognitus]XP_056145508.1 sentrin-specific protease 7 [Lampris incognitus]XP_056145509.1 sentrin-specific protease 7 [Lampris incognitus]